MNARVIGLIGAKGGVGTTTVALNVALALAKEQKAVILVEMRPSFGTLAYHLRQQPLKGLRSILDDFPERCSESDLQVLLSEGPLGLRVLFGPQQADLFKEIEPQHAQAAIKALATMADFVILDLPNQPSVATQTAVRLCCFVNVVTERTLDSVVCAKVALKQLRVWGVAADSVGTIIVNRTENPALVDPADIQTRLGCELVGVIPPGTPANFQTLESGAPVVLTRGDQVAASFVEIAGHFSDDPLKARSFQNPSTSGNGRLL
jgi:pilus assembly protein CpaE